MRITILCSFSKHLSRAMMCPILFFALRIGVWDSLNFSGLGWKSNKFLKLIYLFSVWLLWVLVVAHELFIVAWGLFSSCGAPELLIAVRKLLLLQSTGCRAHRLQYLRCTCSRALRISSPTVWDLSSLTRNWTCAPCPGGQILNQWARRDVL